MERVFLSSIAVLATVASTSPCFADEPTPPSPSTTVTADTARPTDAEKRAHAFGWNDDWPKAQTYELVLTGVFATTAFVGAALPGTPKWTSTNGFDDAARKALRLKNPSDQQLAKDASDIGIAVLVNQAAIDDLFVAWWAHKHPAVAWQMAVMDAETLAFTTGVNSLVVGLVGRQRPYVADLCKQADWKDTSSCTGSGPYRSFFSGHTTAAFTLAGLTCIHHAELGLYDSPAGDAFACVGAMGTATMVGFMRVLSDQHYMSDVIVGAVFGASAGIGLPWLFHYRGGAKLNASTKAHAQKGIFVPPPTVAVTTSGVQLTGVF